MLGQQITLNLWLGGALILGGVLLSLYSPQPALEKPSEKTTQP
jgi:drug/metabolite transporter (DMT)-like permease